MRRSLVLIPSAIGCLLAALAGCAWLSLRHNVTPQAAAQIRPGMTQAEVEAILGGPAGDYYRWNNPEPDFYIAMEYHFSTGRRAPRTFHLWTADDFAVGIQFTESGRVHQVFPSGSLSPGPRGFYINGKNILPDTVVRWFADDPPLDTLEELVDTR